MNPNDDTRVFNHNEIDEATRMADTDDTTLHNPVNPAAPVSRRAISKTQWAQRLGIGAGGAVIGFAAGYASSAHAGTHTSTLAQAAIPDPNDTTTGDSADVSIDDQFALPNSISDTPQHAGAATAAHHAAHNDELLDVAAADHHAARTSSFVPRDNHRSQIIDGNPTSADSINHHVNNHTDHHDSAASATPTHDTVNIDIDGTIPDPSQSILANENGIAYAHVDDSMSFAQAFAAAREQVGAPGVFTWHGNTYGTYYAEEWNNMSQAQRADFIHAVDFPDDINRHAAVAETVPDDNLDVHIHSMTQSMNAEGHISTHAHATIDGNEVHFIDLDGDNNMDMVFIDVDGDGSYTPGVDTMTHIDSGVLTVDDFVDAIEAQNSHPIDPAAMMPDTDVSILGIDDDMASLDFDPNANADF